jgi:dipeptidyl aminopeptidase/acylaminoacyl peptidase
VTRPLWSPDGRYILFAHTPNDSIYRVHADGADEPQQLAKVETATFLSSISPDGKRVAFAAGDPFTGMEVFRRRSAEGLCLHVAIQAAAQQIPNRIRRFFRELLEVDRPAQHFRQRVRDRLAFE